MKLNQRRLRHLLATASAAAMIAGLSATAEAVPICKLVNGVGDFTNTATIDCIEVDTTLTGNIVNTNPGTITNTQFSNPPGLPPLSSNAIVVVGTLSGAIRNTGSVLSHVSAGPDFAINATNTSKITNGITNSNVMSAEGTQTVVGVLISSPTFAGGITNTTFGVIQAISVRDNNTGNALAGGIVAQGGTFFGGILNTGTVSAEAILHKTAGLGISAAVGIADASNTFFGGISSSGLIFAHAGAAVGIGVGMGTAGAFTPVPTFSGGVSNSGTILVTAINGIGDGIGVIASTFSGGIRNSGTIQVSATDHADGIQVNSTSTFFGDVTNSGLITALSQSDFANGMDITNFSTFVGNIVNTGTMIAVNHTPNDTAAGIFVAGSSLIGNVVNTGRIDVTGGSTAYGIFSSVSTFSGGITNTGNMTVTSITDQAIGIYETGSMFFGGITNRGTIQAVGSTGVGVFVRHVSTFSGGITNSGLISASGHSKAFGIYVTSVVTFSGGISNSGTIVADSGFNDASFTGFHAAGIYVHSVSTFAGGITNSGVISVSVVGRATGYGIYVGHVSSFLGGIVNSGTISVFANQTANGIYVRSVVTFSGGITNTGLVNLTGLTGANGIYVESVSSFNGGISNSGTIIARTLTNTAAGIYVTRVSTFSGGIQNSGLIEALSGHSSNFGIAVQSVSTFQGGITNSGTIVASGGAEHFGIYVNRVSTFFGGISNSGTIISQGVFTGAGIYVSSVHSFFGGITNSGLINVNSVDDPAFGIYVSSVSTFSGNIVNSGTILVTALDGGGAGIYVASVSTFLGGVTNKGLISVSGASDVEGIYVSLSRFGGGITNSGTILVTSAADAAAGILVVASTFSGGITNSGLINASSGGLFGDFADGIDVRAASTFFGGITNSGTIVAHGGTFATGIFASASTFFGNIVNSGTIIVGAGLGGVDGLLLSISMFSGGITNTGLISASGHTTADGIDLHASTFTGGITNTGTILATSALAAGRGMVIRVSTFFGGITNSGVVSGKGVTGFGIYVLSSTFAGGITNSGLISGSGTTALGKGYGIYLDPPTFLGNIVNTGTIIGIGQPGTSHAAIDGSLVLNSFTITNTGGTIDGGVALSATVADTFNINGGFVNGKVTGAAATVNFTSGKLELPVGASIGQGPADGGTPITAFNMSAGTLQLNVTPTPADPNQSPIPTLGPIQGTNGHIAANTINITGGNFVVGVRPGIYAPTTIYDDVIVGSGANTAIANFAHVFTTSGVVGATLLADRSLTTDPQNTATADDLRLNFIGFGHGFVFNGAGPNLGETPNEQAAGGGVDALLNLPPAQVGPLVGPLFALSGQTLLGALDQLGGVEYAANFNLMSGSPIFTSDSVQTLLWARGGGGNSLASARLGQSGMQIASAGQVLTDAGQQTAQIPAGGPSAEHWSVWGRGYGVFGDVKDQTTPNVVPGFKENRYGGIVGADYSFNEHWLVGGVANFSYDKVDFKQSAGNTKVDTYLFGLYGQYRQGPWYVNAIGSGGFGNFTSIRNITMPIPAVAHSSYNGENYGGYVEGGWDFPVASFKATPFLGLGYLHQTIDQFTESGAGLEDLTVKGDENSLQTSLGIRASTTFQVGGGWLTPELRVIWQHEFLDEAQEITNAFAVNPGATFNIRGAKLSRDSGVIGGGLTYTVSPNAKVFVDYDFKANSDFTAHQVSAGMRWTFGAPPPPPPQPAPPPLPAAQPAPPPPAQAQVFVVYFDFDKSVLTPEAVGIIRQAADTFKRTGAVTIKIDGYTDLAGTQKYNVGLSKRRADTVRAELAKDGVPNNAVAEAWHGKQDPAVPTPDGVREPRNRRVTLALP